MDQLTPGDALVLASVPVRRAGQTEAVALAAGVPVATAVASLGRLELEGFVRREGQAWRKVPNPSA